MTANEQRAALQRLARLRRVRRLASVTAIVTAVASYFLGAEKAGAVWPGGLLAHGGRDVPSAANRSSRIQWRSAVVGRPRRTARGVALTFAGAGTYSDGLGNRECDPPLACCRQDATRDFAQRGSSEADSTSHQSCMPRRTAPGG
jgi:hypothetical protein